MRFVTKNGTKTLKKKIAFFGVQWESTESIPVVYLFAQDALHLYVNHKQKYQTKIGFCEIP